MIETISLVLAGTLLTALWNHCLHTSAAKLAALPERDQYIEMELWRGLMANHSFVVHRSDEKTMEQK
jgi:hypothetical protein